MPPSEHTSGNDKLCAGAGLHHVPLAVIALTVDAEPDRQRVPARDAIRPRSQVHVPRHRVERHDNVRRPHRAKVEMYLATAHDTDNGG